MKNKLIQCLTAALFALAVAPASAEIISFTCTDPTGCEVAVPYGSLAAALGPSNLIYDFSWVEQYMGTGSMSQDDRYLGGTWDGSLYPVTHEGRLNLYSASGQFFSAVFAYGGAEAASDFGTWRDGRVPEPSTLALLSLDIAGFALARRRQH